MIDKKIIKQTANNMLEKGSIEGSTIEYKKSFDIVSNVRLFKDSLVKIIGDIFDSYDSLINLFGGQCQII